MNGVVPLSVELIELYVDSVKLFIRDLSASWVFSRVKDALHFQTSFCCRRCNHVDNRSVAKKRPSPPILGYERE